MPGLVFRKDSGRSVEERCLSMPLRRVSSLRPESTRSPTRTLTTALNARLGFPQGFRPERGGTVFEHASSPRFLARPESTRSPTRTLTTALNARFGFPQGFRPERGGTVFQHAPSPRFLAPPRIHAEPHQNIDHRIECPAWFSARIQAGAWRNGVSACPFAAFPRSAPNPRGAPPE